MTIHNWTDGYNLRPMTEADVDSVHALESSTSPHPWTPGIIRNCLTTGDRCWLLEKDNLLVGYTVTMVAVGEGHILNIAITPDFQRQGLGQRLLDFLIQDLAEQKANIIFLEVRTSNTSAIELYLKNNFTEVGRRNNYYPCSRNGREDALVMVKDLSFQM
ncbi:ribosomal protein S18-alanine N-acetyltransferase [Parendozoicomonas sp. Alg238-R29]|uniref:ribosomal protein S18-alanine N-acetyltransferase n=1 Tax=Parendozoicomonas sp. Alg238-R29 TaxID=2993446 RepID=UPI00248D5D75|nr:ribosomal protein S18-alanine N-acetyltransferase [Parendozoicomonas sp. Alg238-R29]